MLDVSRITFGYYFYEHYLLERIKTACYVLPDLGHLFRARRDGIDRHRLVASFPEDSMALIGLVSGNAGLEHFRAMEYP